MVSGTDSGDYYMNMKKIYTAAAAVLSICMLSGCGNTKIVLTTGLASDELFRIGNVSCDLSEALIYLANEKNQYETIYGIEMWEHDFGDMTMEDYLKNQVVSQLAQIKSMILLAEEKEIALTDEEKDLAGQAAAEYYGSLSEEEARLLKVDQEQIQEMYEDYCLSEKAYQQITEDVSVEISDDEARIIKLQQIYVPEKNLADELRDKLEKGEDFESLASNYSKASQVTISVARGDQSEEYEAVAFDLNNDEISDVFAADGGYYILKCLDTYMKEESEANKIRVAQQQKTERFQSIYADLMKDTLSEFQQKLWDQVHFSDYEAVKTSNFFEVYQGYFTE